MHWEGSFEEYLDIVLEHPEVTRTAYQRLYDMILSHGTEEVYENKEKVTRFKFFTEFAAQHGDAHLRPRPAAACSWSTPSSRPPRATAPSAACCCCTARSARSKSTIARLLKRGLEEYSRTDAGMLFSFAWKMRRRHLAQKCPMHEEPLQLVPLELRAGVLRQAQRRPQADDDYEVTIKGDLCPFCR